MKRRLYHPLWTHAPAAGLVVAVVVLAFSSLLPERVPVHFGANGRPDRWGSPWELVFIALLLIVAWAVIDELWARQERPKAFNWMSLIDECLIGFLAGFTFAQVGAVGLRQGEFSFPWAASLACAGGAVLAATVLECLRPHRPHEKALETEDTRDLTAQIAERLRSGQPWVYWEKQDPLWMRLAAAWSCVVMVIGAAYMAGPAPWLIPVFALGAGLLVAVYGGLRVTVDHQRVVVRLGIFGVRLLRLEAAGLTEVAVQDFSPLQDFGGWGIRRGRGMWAFFFRGTRGVRLQTASGKKYLIGSDHPDRLAAAVRAVLSHTQKA